MVSIRKDVRLPRKEGATGINEVNARQIILTLCASKRFLGLNKYWNWNDLSVTPVNRSSVFELATIPTLLLKISSGETSVPMFDAN